ncbi:formylglycine-generating enzyme family protein [Rhodocytophaga rosea]|uniref:formylglycine-generating enzyme family protein n=1 Tax=Rhodocytophaga rosea TaxID=2704465 RepID=UPI0021D18EB2|nr:formylglycine-generating enzyme family protein [Rhodocytophaga rosea]
MKILVMYNISICLLLFAFPLFAQKSEFTNTIGMEFVLINPGSFTLGKFQPPYPKPKPKESQSSQPGRGNGYTPAQYQLAKKMAKQDAREGFQVSIDKPFYLGKFEVTQAQWKRVMGKNPSVFQGKQVTDDPDMHPVENITWQEAQAFLKKLTQLEGGKVVYRLPTEFEWEYAARAGTQDDIAWSEIRLSAQMGIPATALVGQKKPNAWGFMIHWAMCGNGCRIIIMRKSLLIRYLPNQVKYMY